MKRCSANLKDGESGAPGDVPVARKTVAAANQ